jgi:predicted phosphodiesterase
MPSPSAITRALDRALAESAPAERPLDIEGDSYVIFSDHHKGQRDGADDFAVCEPAYLAALDHYLEQGATLIVLGDAEELWENRVEPVLEAYGNVLATERRFHADRFVKVWGNHDDEWEAPRRVDKHLPTVFGPIQVVEGLRFAVMDRGERLGTLLLLHGHQGTLFSDRLAGLAKIAVRFVWRTIQRIIRKGSTTPATDACLRAEHDRMMYAWASRHPGLVLIAGHTHRPVFSSKTHLQQVREERRALERMDDLAEDVRLQARLEQLHELEEKIQRQDEACASISEDGVDRSRPCYFNTGCCSFADSDITGIELTDGEIRLVKWETKHGGPPRRETLARTSLAAVFQSLGSSADSAPAPPEP